MGERLPVSVVIPTYNRPAACRAAVQSVLAQRPLPLEVLVCDDASPLRVVDELREWCALRWDIEFIGLPQNRGPSTARNMGIERARGDWVAFLDDDDLWLPGKLAAQWSAAQSGRWDVIAANGLRADGTAFYSTPPPRAPTYADLHAANPIILSTALARRARVLEAAGSLGADAMRRITSFGLRWRTVERDSSFSRMRSCDTTTRRRRG